MPSDSAPCRSGGIRGTLLQTTAPVAIACHPSSIAGTSSSARPPRSGVWGASGAMHLSSRARRYHSICRVCVRRFALAAREYGELLKYKNYKITNFTKRYSSTSPCIELLSARQMGGIRSTRFQTTAPVAITCLPSAIVGAGSSVRPSHNGREDQVLA